jgi:hypothetical protein
MDDVPIELVALELQSTQPIMIGDSFFDVFVHLEGLGGMIEEGANNQAGILEVPPFGQGGADSFFDVFFEVELTPHLSEDAGKMALMVRPAAGPAPPRFTGRLTNKPPAAGDGFHLSVPVRLVDAAGNPAGSLQTVDLTLGPAGPAPGLTRVLECYRLDKGADPNDPVRLTTRNFGRDDVLVRTANEMCEGAIKARQPQPVTIPPPSVVWECYDINNGFDPKKSVRLTTQNFGDNAVEVGKAVKMCEEAMKVRINAAGTVQIVGRPTGRVFECFRIKGKNIGAPFNLTTTNFGSDDVSVRKPSMMCEPARKERLPNFPPFEEPTPTPTPAGVPD